MAQNISYEELVDIIKYENEDNRSVDIFTS